MIRITGIGHSPAISYVFLRTLRARSAYRRRTDLGVTSESSWCAVTTWPGNKLNCELSGTGRLADLYSDFGVQRILECLCSSKSGVSFSATGRGLRTAKYPAKCDKNGVSVVTSLTIKTSWRRTQSRANPSPAKFPANREKYREFREFWAS